MHLSIKVHSELLDLSSPRIMAIVNVTSDSFYTSWGNLSQEALLRNVEQLLEQGADIIDLGACSTRPQSTPVTAEVEWQNLHAALQLIRSAFPRIVISVDTFRADIAEKAILSGADIINDVYGGMDEHMWDVVAKYDVPYVLTHSQDLLSLTNDACEYDATMSAVVDFFQSKLDQLHQRGVKDVMIDPGFGFGKTEQQNYAILRQMDLLSHLHAPVLVGVSRKSMLYKPLGISPSDVLPATVAANVMALERGANILRVHDVDAAKQAIIVYSLVHTN